MPSFDIVSQVDMQEVRNAVDQSMREVVNRYDFKGTDTKISLTEDGIAVESETDHRVEAAIDVLQTKLVRRKVSLKSLSGGEIKPVGGGRSRATFTLNQGINQDDARELATRMGELNPQTAAEELALFDVGVSLSLTRFLATVHKGRIDPASVDFDLGAGPKTTRGTALPGGGARRARGTARRSRPGRRP